MTGFELKEAKTELEFVKDRFYDFPEETGVSNSINNIQNAIKAIEELEEYYTIGTVEECREARERQRAKKPVYPYLKSLPTCPNCGEENIFHENESCSMNTSYDYRNFCPDCGQAIDWYA